MGVGYKTLILIDNSNSVGSPNFTLCKETAKYICNHMNESDEYRIATFGNETEYLTDYSSDNSSLVSAIDGIELCDRDTMITDTLVEIINEWKEQDVACRDIILFTDGDESVPILHANEELYYLLEELNYPVYVVQSVESKSENAAKNLSAIATLSRGKLFLTEFDNSEAESEITLGKQVLEAIEISKGMYTTEKNDEEIEAVEMDEALGNSEVSESEYLQVNSDMTDAAYFSNGVSGIGEYEMEENNDSQPLTNKDNSTIYRTNNGPSFAETYGNMIIPMTGLALSIIFAGVMAFIFKRKKADNYGRDNVIEGVRRELEREAEIAEYAEDYDCETRPLFEDDCNPTRLLCSDSYEHNIVLEDCNDPTKLFRAASEDTLIVGRSKAKCDVVIDYDDSVSGRHCELSIKENNWYVRDLKSSNGTKVNGQKVFQELLLNTGDVLQLGQLALQVRL